MFVSLCVFLSVYLYLICLCLSLSHCLPVSVYLVVSVSLSYTRFSCFGLLFCLSRFLPLSICLSLFTSACLCLPLYVSVCLCLSVCVFRSLCLSPSLSVCLSNSLSLSLSVSLTPLSFARSLSLSPLSLSVSLSPCVSVSRISGLCCRLKGQCIYLNTYAALYGNVFSLLLPLVNSLTVGPTCNRFLVFLVNNVTAEISRQISSTVYCSAAQHEAIQYNTLQ